MNNVNNMKNIGSKGSAGYIALTAAIVISVLLLAITVSLGLSGSLGRFNILDSESKERSKALADACGNKALLDLAFGGAYIGPITVIGSDVCTIVSVTPDTPLFGSTTIKTQAFVNNSYTNLKIVADSNTIDVISWEECSRLDLPPCL